MYVGVMYVGVMYVVRSQILNRFDSGKWVEVGDFFCHYRS
jgi:hypothetical protein